jgi:hypothetical protein
MSYLVPIPSYFADTEYSKQRDTLYHCVRFKICMYKYYYRTTIRSKFTFREANKKVNPPQIPYILVKDWRMFQ